MSDLYRLIVDSLGKPIEDPGIQLLNEEIGEPAFIESGLELAYHRFFKSGIKFLYVHGKRLWVAEFFLESENHEQGTYEPYVGTLPYDLNARDCMRSVEDKLKDLSIDYSTESDWLTIRSASTIVSLNFDKQTGNLAFLSVRCTPEYLTQLGFPGG